jgi:hypothetical protein
LAATVWEKVIATKHPLDDERGDIWVVALTYQIFIVRQLAGLIGQQLDCREVSVRKPRMLSKFFSENSRGVGHRRRLRTEARIK